MSCWQCEAEVAPGAVVCATCGVAQPPTPDLDPFTRLGFDRTCALTNGDLAARRIELLDVVHPDRFAAHAPAAREHALAQATAINDATRALADVLGRVEVLMRLRGWDGARPPPDAALRLRLGEFDTAAAELQGVDAHSERTLLGRRVAAEFQATLDGVANGLESGALSMDDARAPLTALYALRGVLERLDQLDTTPNRIGERRR